MLPIASPGEPNDDLIARLLQGQTEIPDVIEFTKAVLIEFEGVAGLAAQLKLEYDSSNPGSISRKDILRSVVDLVKATAALRSNVNPLQGVTPDEMRAAIKKITKQDEDA